MVEFNYKCPFSTVWKQQKCLFQALFRCLRPLNRGVRLIQVSLYITSWETPSEDSQPREDEVGIFHVRKKVMMLAGKKLKLNPKKARPGALPAALFNL